MPVKIYIIKKEQIIMTIKKRNVWTEEEDNLLKEIYSNSFKKDILSKIKKPWNIIRYRAGKKGLKRDLEIVQIEMKEGGKQVSSRTDVWTECEDKYLISAYKCISRKDILINLPNRSWGAIKQRALKLKLKRDSELVKKENLEYSQKSMLDKYGVKSSFSLKSTQDKIKQTNIERLGVAYPTQSSLVRDKVKKTVQEIYGVDNVFQSEDIKKEIENTNLLRYNTKSPIQNEKIKEKIANTCNDKYNVDNPFKLVNRVKEGMIKKYGVPSALKNDEIKEKWKNTNKERYGVDYPSQNEEIRRKLSETHKSLEVREKKLSARRGKIYDCSKEEKEFYNLLLNIDPSAIHHEVHPEFKWEIDYYLPKFNLWVQFDGEYWHGKINSKGDGPRSRAIRDIIERDKLQNEKIPNLVRFWADEVRLAIKNKSVKEYVEKVIFDKINSSSIKSYQYLKKQKLYLEDTKNLPFNPDNVKARDFLLERTPMSKEISGFIKRYEWLGNYGNIPKWCFIAKYRDILCGVVLINEPNSYSNLLGKDTKKYEAVIQRGATISWAPRNLGSRLVMFSCNWMVKNTEKRAFIGYADPRASEIGFIYQACNFEYLGNNFGVDYLYRHEKIDKNVFGKQYLDRTSTLKKWCRDNGIVFSKDWLNKKGYKDISKIPLDVLDAWKDWKRRIIKESDKIKQTPKSKYVLLLPKNATEKKSLYNLKKYEPKQYKKSYYEKQLPEDTKNAWSTSDRKTRAKIQYILDNYGKVPRIELALNLNETERWVKRQIKNLIKSGKITPKSKTTHF